MSSGPLPAVAIIGRPNVGKSTLFNRIAGKRLAIVNDEPGVTRDRLIARAEWDGHEFSVIDTGGFEAEREATLAGRVREQSLRAVEDARVLVLVVDGRVGRTPADVAIARLLQATGKPVVCVVNKIDTMRQEDLAYEYFGLGLGAPLAISAEHGRGIDELLDRVVASLPEGSAPPPSPALRLAIVGRPNVGKSSLLNRLVGDERVLVDEAAGTTRDPVDLSIHVDGKEVLLVDTAGIRRRSRIDRELEKATVAAALRSISRADVALLVVDASEGVTEQDARIAHVAWERGKGVLLVVNKWDTLPPDKRQVDEFLADVRRQNRQLDNVPAVAVSALRNTGIEGLLPAAERVAAAHRLRLPTHVLNRALAEACAATEPPLHRGKRARVYYATAVSAAPPTIALFVNYPEHVTTAYLRYLENRLRAEFPLEGTPLRLLLRARPRSPSRARPRQTEDRKRSRR